MNTMSFSEMMQQKPDYLRVGQQFVILFIKEPWPELFYADDDRAHEIILDWLMSLHYDTSTPLIVVDRGSIAPYGEEDEHALVDHVGHVDFRQLMDCCIP